MERNQVTIPEIRLKKLSENNNIIGTNKKIIYFDSYLDENDEFFILKDFDAYIAAHEEIVRRYQDKDAWLRSSAINIANSGVFSSDRTIKEYAEDIWEIEPVEIK